MKIKFEAGTGNHFPGSVNFLISEDRSLYAECSVPEGASDDYGYLEMKDALIDAVKAAGGDPDELEFWYDGQEQYLAADAAAICEVYVEYTRRPFFEEAKEAMKREMIKAIRLVNGFDTSLRVKLDYSPRTTTAAQQKIQNFILDHLTDLFGVGIYDKLGVKYNPQPGTDAEDYAKVMHFAELVSRAVCLGEAED